MAMSSNQKMIAGVAGAAVVAVAAFMAGRHQSAPEGPMTAGNTANAVDEANAAKQSGNDAVPAQRNNNGNGNGNSNTNQRVANNGRSNNGDSGGYADSNGNNATQQAVPRLCAECATVVSVRQETREGKGSGIGVVGGAVIGGLLGNQIGGGTGKKVATVGGAVAGGYAGNEIEKRQRSTTVWVVRLRNADQSTRNMEFSHDPQVQNGDVVRARDGRLERQ
ncbi:glycine zipper 2TM domain-containing protein [Roseateles amylovorans]|uniref:Glycine zipper 2TM domain-containing protein n=1 Tax=Roseateles amylovorans TaxID=2978473 RepID=A0ABY6B3G2_9BURK|nr:glycine zipper 2TM domain-containing protein [Roseateles amylovorans]UXH78771.1 glycine zipper 2TM domain-containing protein [Roseateles amylovorans]